jgi:ubiquinone/menaquinone biosynthesis C-methylase UbiE
LNSLVTEHFGSMASVYDGRTLANDRKEIEEVVSKVLGIRPSLVLDVGCGTGTTLFRLVGRVKKAWGIDITPGMLREARKKKGKLGMGNVTFLRADAETLPFPDDFFDVAICRYAFHHFPRPRKALSEIARVVRPGGGFVFNDIIAPERTGGELNSIERKLNPSHVKYYSKRELNRLARAAGFRTVFSGKPLLRRVLGSAHSKDREQMRKAVILYKRTSPAFRRSFSVGFVDGDFSLTERSAVIVFRKS